MTTQEHKKASEKVQAKAEAIVREILLLPKVKPEDSEIFSNEDYEELLKDIPFRVQEIIEEAFKINTPEGTQSKQNILINFLRICDFEEIHFFNPFNLWIIQDENYRNILHNKITKK